MTDTTVKIPIELVTLLDVEVIHDPRWRTRSELVRNILWDWVKDQQAKQGVREDFHPEPTELTSVNERSE